MQWVCQAFIYIIMCLLYPTEPTYLGLQLIKGTSALQVPCLRAVVIGVSTCGYVRHFYMLIAVVYYACASCAF